MTMIKLASMISKLEGKKSLAKIGDIREILSILSDLLYAEGLHGNIYNTLAKNGMRRSKIKKTKNGRK